MRLSDFIRSHAKEIVQEWESFARTCLPAASAMDDARLRDHIVELAAFIANDMDSAQSSFEQMEKAHGRSPDPDGDSEAETHAIMRAADGFTYRPGNRRVSSVACEHSAPTHKRTDNAARRCR